MNSIGQGFCLALLGLIRRDTLAEISATLQNQVKRKSSVKLRRKKSSVKDGKGKRRSKVLSRVVSVG